MRSEDLINKDILNQNTALRLDTIRERKLALKSLLRAKDIRDLLAVREVMGDNAIAIFNNELDTKSADEL